MNKMSLNELGEYYTRLSKRRKDKNPFTIDGLINYAKNRMFEYDITSDDNIYYVSSFGAKNLIKDYYNVLNHNVLYKLVLIQPDLLTKNNIETDILYSNSIDAINYYATEEEIIIESRDNYEFEWTGWYVIDIINTPFIFK